MESLEYRRVLTASLEGTVYVDHTNELPTASDIVLTGVTLTLTGTTTGGSSINPQTTTTASDGSYSFSNLAAGTYTITESQPSKIEAGSSFSGTLGGSSATLAISNITVGASDAGTGYDFREAGLPFSSIGLALFLDSTPSAETYYNDLVASSTSAPAPMVSSVVLASANPTGASTVDFTVNFSQNVTGVDSTAFALNSSSTISGASITSVTGSGSSYTVAVATGTASGTIGLNVVDNGKIFGATGQALGSGSGNVLFTGPSYTFTANSAPSITSATTATFTTGTAGTFTVTASGVPAPTFTETGALPTGVTFNTTTGVLSGTATAGVGANYAITFTATNSAGTSATQSFTLVVDDAPLITSAATTTFTTGAAGTFTVTATGFPAPTFSETGTLPTGVTFNSTTGVLSGTVAAGGGGSFPITITATNGIGATASQSFNLSVDDAPAITSAASTTFTMGTAGTFQVTASGFPAPTFTTTSTLPAGVTLSSAGVLSGTPTADGTFTITIAASNAVGAAATQTFTLTIQSAVPTIAVPAAQTTPLNTALVFSTANSNAISIADVSVGSNTVQLELTATDGALTLATTTGLTITAGANDSSTVTVQGTLTAINAALAGLSFAPTNGFGGAASVKLDFSDLGLGGVDTAQTASQTVAIAVNAPTIQITSSASSVVFGQSVTFTATLAAVSPATGDPTGTVKFMVGTQLLGTGTLTDGVATFTTSALGVGSNSIIAIYSGDTTFAGITASVFTQTVTQAASTTTLTSNANSPTGGDSVTFTATLAAVSPGVGTPTGTVTFLDGTTTLGTSTITDGVATFSTTALNIGSNSITAVYNGDTNFTTSTSSALSVTVGVGAAPVITVPAAQTTPLSTPLIFSAANSNQISVVDGNVGSANVQLTITATNGDLALGTTGGVTITAGANNSPTVTIQGTLDAINNAISALNFTPTTAFTGAATISLSFSDLGNGGTSTAQTASGTVTVSVNAPTTTLVSSASSVVYGQSVTFTATIAAVSPATGTPTGTVTFMDGTNTLGTGTLSNGVATFTTSALGAATHSITAVYSGDTNFGPSTSAVLTQTVTPAPLTITSVSEATKTYDGTTDGTSPTIVLGGVIGSDVVTASGTATFASAGVGSGIAVSVTGITLSGAAASNYTLASTTANTTADITAATPTVTVSDDGGTFTGNAFAATAQVAGVVTGVDTTPASSLETVSPTLSYYSGTGTNGTLLSGAPTDAGTYTVVANFAGSANYAAATSAPVTFTIAPATPTVDVTDAGGSFTGDAFPATATVTGVDGTAASSLETVSPTLAYFAGSGTNGTALSGAPSAAGTYTVQASFAGSANYAAATSAPVTFTIAPATPTVDVTDAGGTFDGNAFPATATVTGVDGVAASSLESVSPTLSYFTGSTTNGTALTGAPTAVGTYTVEASFAGSADYASATSAPVTFTITQATPTVAVTDAGGAFTGDTFPATATVTGVGGTAASSLESVTPTLSYFAGSTTNGTALSGAPSAAGTYTVVANFAGSANYAAANSSAVTFTIAQATPIVDVTDAGGTFTGSAFAATATVTGVSGTAGSSLESVTPTLSYFAGTTTNGTALSGAPSAAGTYTVVANFAGSANYAAANSSAVTFTIAQATPTVDVTDAGGTFTGSAFAATATVTGVSGTAGSNLDGVTPTLSYFAGSTTAGTALSGAPTAAGTYTVEANFAGSANYASATSTPVTFTIAQATPTVDVTDAGGTFTGSAFTATATVTGVSGTAGSSLDSVTPTLSYFAGSTTNGTALSGAPSAAGTYTVEANFAGSANYASATSTPVTFTIAQATPTVDVTDAGGTFTGSAFAATATVTGVSGTAGSSLDSVTPTLSYFAGSTTNGTALSGAPSAAGTYTVVANFAGSANYASATSTPVTFTIAQATPTVDVTDAGGTFNGDAFPATATVTGVGGAAASNLETVTPTLSYFAGSTTNGTALSGAPSAAGTYTVVANFAGSADYASASSSPVTFTIAQATPTVVVTDAGGEANGSPFPATATVTGVSGTAASSLESVTPTLSYYTGSTPNGIALSGAPSAAGTYTVVASFAGSANYVAVDSSPVTFTITSSTAPMVSSIALADADPTNAATVSYTVTFSESVTGATAAAFALAPSGGLTGSSIASVSGSGSVYTVTVDVGTGTGTLRLDQVSDPSVVDGSGNSLQGAFTGPAYTITS